MARRYGYTPTTPIPQPPKKALTKIGKAARDAVINFRYNGTGRDRLYALLKGTFPTKEEAEKERKEREEEREKGIYRNVDDVTYDDFTNEVETFFNGTPEQVYEHYVALKPSLQTMFDLLLHNDYLLAEEIEDACGLDATDILPFGSYWSNNDDLFGNTTNGPFSWVWMEDSCKELFAMFLPDEKMVEPPSLSDAVTTAPAGHVYSALKEIKDALPNAIDEFQTVRKTNDTCARLNKGMCDRVRNLCGIDPFPVAGAYGLDPASLLMQWIACLKLDKTRSKEDAFDLLAKEIARFFDTMTKLAFPLEAQAFLSFFTKKSGGVYGYNKKLKNRDTIEVLLQKMAESGEWYDVNTLFEHYYGQTDCIEFESTSFYTEGLSMKAEAIEWHGKKYSCMRNDYAFTINPEGGFDKHMLLAPIFKSYFYLLASLGLVDITEKEITNLPVYKGKDKRQPFSPADGLDKVKINALGQWVFGATETKPVVKQDAFQVIVDSSLLLVTFTGKNNIRDAYLSSVGVPLGTERYKITEQSFTGGCKSPAMLDEKIARFKELITPTPPENWLKFFASLKEKSDLFTAFDRAYVFTVKNPLLIASLLEDPKSKGVFLKAEGNLLIVRYKERKAALKLLKDHAVVVEEWK